MNIIDKRESILKNAIKGVSYSLKAKISSLSGNESFSDIYAMVLDSFSLLTAVEVNITNYTDIAKRIKKEFSDSGLDIVFDDSDVLLINSMSESGRSIIKSIKDEYVSAISSAVYTNMISNIDNNTIQENVDALIIPNKNITGRSILSVLLTETETFVMEADATLMLKKGNEYGIDKYKYIGSLIKDSRSWCVNHLNEVLTLDQINDWSKSNWKGKKYGSPFVTRGGWRCRHHFAPIIDS